MIECQQWKKVLIGLSLLFGFDRGILAKTFCEKIASWLLDPRIAESRLVGEAETEASLKALGYKESYIKGFDQIEGHLRLAEKLRTVPIDPWSTYTEEFAALVKPHLDHVQKGIRSQNSSDTTERLAILEDFRAEALGWVQRRELSYRRWVNLNFRLSILATPAPQRGDGTFENGFRDRLYASGDWLTDERLEAAYREGKKRELFNSSIIEMLDRFPEAIIIPQKDGLVGRMALSRTSARRVYIHTLEAGTSDIHDEVYYPDMAFWHDVVHMDYRERAVADWMRRLGPYERTVIPFHDAFILAMRRSSKREREMLEFMYYILVREDPQRGYSSINADILGYPGTQVLLTDLVATDLHNYHAVSLPDWVQPNIEDIRRFVAESMRLFDRRAKKAFRKMPKPF